MSATDSSSLISAGLDDLVSRLVAFEPTPLPVLSVYLNLQPDQHGRDPNVKPYLERELGALARTWPSACPERRSFDDDVQRILSYVDDKVDPAANGLAIFACSGEMLFETAQLPAPIEEHRIYVYHQPHLYHLARLDDEYPLYAAVVTDANTARIYVCRLGQTIHSEDVNGKKVHRVKVGGWSQARYQRRVINAHQDHAKEIVDRLERIVREEKIKHILLAGEPTFKAVLREEMPKALAESVVDTVSIDSNAGDDEILRKTLETIREEDSKTDAEKVEKLFNQYRGRALAVVGPEATLQALANGQVDELLISAALEKSRPEREPVEAILAPEIPDASGGTESEEPRSASIPDLLVTKAKQTGATVTFIEDPTLLASVDGVGALLRWRN